MFPAHQRSCVLQLRLEIVLIDNSTNVGKIVKVQIVFLLSRLTEENFERNQVEIRSVRAGVA